MTYSRNWNDLEIQLRLTVENAIPATSGWAAKPYCQRMLDIIPPLKAEIDLHDLILLTTHDVPFFQITKHSKKVHIWPDDSTWPQVNEFFKIWLSDGDYEIEKTIISKSEVVAMLKEYLHRLQKEADNDL